MRRELELELWLRSGFDGGQVMFNNRKERKELLEALVISNKDAKVPVLPQV